MDHSAGRQTVCYVNPAAPADAVIQRGFNGEMAFGGLGLIFFLLGAYGLYYALRRARPNTA